MNSFNFKAMLKAAMACATAAVCALAPLAAEAGNAKNATTGTAICDFSSFNFDQASNTLSINCTGTSTQNPTPTATTFTWSANTTSIPVGGTATARINRPATSTANIYVYYNILNVTNVSGWKVNGGDNATQWVEFAANQTYVDLPIIAGNTAGSFTLVIDRTTDVASLVPTGTTATNQVTVTSNSVITPTQPSTTQPVCGTASQTAEFTTNGQKHEFILAPGQTASVGFTARDGTLVKFSTTETQFTYAENDHQVTISTCAGTFTTTDPGCTYNAIMTGGQLQAAVGGANGVCGLVAGRKYYMNIRQVRLDGSNSCTNPSGCGIRAQNQGL